MTEKELNTVRDLHKRIRDLERHIRVLRLSANNLAPMIDGLPHSSEIKSRVEKLALMILEEERKLDNLREQIANAALDLTEKINCAPLNLQEKSVLLMRYVACKNFQAIWFEMETSDARIFYLHRTALKIFLKIKVD